MPRLDDALLVSLVGRIYEAATDRTQWGPVLGSLAELYDGMAVLFMQDLGRGDSAVAEFRRFDEAFMRSYVHYYGSRSPWLDPLARLPAGSIVTDASLTERSALVRTEFYADWLRPQGLGPAIGVILEKTGTLATNLAFNRPERRGPITETEFHFLSALAPHLRRALRVHRELAAARLERDAALEGLEALGLGALVADGEARLLFANRDAERLLRTPGGGLAVQHGRLVGLTPAATAELRAAVRVAATPAAAGALLQGHPANGQAAACAGILRLPRRDGDPLPVLVGPLRGQGGAGAFGLGGPAALLFVRAPGGDRSAFPDERRLALLYGLTPAEARLLAALLRGIAPQDYARENHISPNTIKTQFRQVFEKTGQNRQADLVRHVLSDPVARLAVRPETG